jgi:hypothetical protein
VSLWRARTPQPPVELGGVPQISDRSHDRLRDAESASTLGQTEMMEIGQEIVALIPVLDGLQVEIGGQALSEFDPPEAELIGLAFAIVILIVVVRIGACDGSTNRGCVVWSGDRGQPCGDDFPSDGGSPISRSPSVRCSVSLSVSTTRCSS